MAIIHKLTVKSTTISIVSMYILYHIYPLLPIVAPMLVSLGIMSTYPEHALLGEEFTKAHKQAWAIQAILFLVGIIILFLPCI